MDEDAWFLMIKCFFLISRFDFDENIKFNHINVFEIEYVGHRQIHGVKAEHR